MASLNKKGMFSMQSSIVNRLGGSTTTKLDKSKAQNFPGGGIGARSSAVRRAISSKCQPTGVVCAEIAYTTEVAASAVIAALMDCYTPFPFTSILTKPYSPAPLPSAVATSFSTCNRYMIKYGTNFLTIDSGFNLVLTPALTTYKDVLSKVLEAVCDPSNNPTTSFRLDSDLETLYSLDCSSSTAVVKFSNNWGQAANGTCGFLRLEYSDNHLIVKGRQYISDAFYNHSTDNTFTATGYYVCYDSASGRFKLTSTLSSAATFTLYKSPIQADMPSDFNPYAIPYQPNARVSIKDYVGPKVFDSQGKPHGAKITISGMDSSVKRDLSSVYFGQVDVSGWSVNTDISANRMLDSIFETNANLLRYDKSVYKAFRTAALKTTLGCNSVADGTIGQNTVPYVYFTNDVSGGVHHPFMVMASYSISDKPNRLIDVCRPPADGDGAEAPYPHWDVTRDVTLQNYLVKIPMRDYGLVTSCTSSDKNTMLASLLSDAGFPAGVPATAYNYASNSAIGVAVDGVVIYPMANNTLHPAQAQAEITNTGIHIGRGMGLHYHADGQSASPNNLNLYNTLDYTSRHHPPLIGFGLDGIALYGRYEVGFSSMQGYTTVLDGFGGHNHGNYGYHYHAHVVDVSSNATANLASLGIKTQSGVDEPPLPGVPPPLPPSLAYKLHILMKGAWAGRVDGIPEFWDIRMNAPSYTLGTNNSKFAGMK